MAALSFWTWSFCLGLSVKLLLPTQVPTQMSPPRDSPATRADVNTNKVLWCCFLSFDLQHCLNLSCRTAGWFRIHLHHVWLPQQDPNKALHSKAPECLLHEHLETLGRKELCKDHCKVVMTSQVLWLRKARYGLEGWTCELQKTRLGESCRRSLLLCCSRIQKMWLWV